MTPTYKLAVNTVVIDKPERDDPVFSTELTYNWQNVEWTGPQIAAHINHGHPICAQHSKRRKSDNFVASNVIATDIDEGWSEQALLNDDFVNSNAYMIYPTVSHTELAPHFRVIYLSAEPITNKDDMKAALTGAIYQLGGDESCKDACRMFFGSQGSNPIILGNVLSAEALAALIAAGSEQRISDSDGDPDRKNSSRTVVTNRSGRYLAADQVVRVATGSTLPLDLLPAKTRIHCPMHSDRTPSAMVITNKEEKNGVYCSRCAQSFWPASMHRKRRPFEFRTLPRLVSELEYAEDDHQLDVVGMPKNPNPYPQEGRTAFTFCEQFIPSIPLADGVTFVRSPKGSGKTEWLKKIVAQCREHGLSVLLIGHRQTLLQALAARLGLTCYFYVEEGKHKNNRPNSYYAICLDSMGKLLKPDLHQYDVVLIDESEQVFSHLTASTLNGKRRYCYVLLAHYLKHARSVILSDADLDAITLEAVGQAVADDTPYRIFLNEYRPDAPDFQLYKDEPHLVSEMLEAIRSGGLHFVSTNSIRKAKMLKEAIESNVARRLKIMLITSEETGDQDVQYFVNHIATEFPKYDVVIASPTLGTGIDITFADAAPLIDTVFGFFMTRVNTHFDIDQQLCRVRHPKAIKVTVSPERYTFETDPEVIKAEMLMCRNLNDMIVGISRDGTPDVDDTYMSIYAQVASIQRASKNNLRQNLIDLRKQNGWRVVMVEKAKEEAASGKAAMKAAAAVVEAEFRQGVCEAAPITAEEYAELKLIGSTQPLSLPDKYSMRRYQITSFYREDISEDLILLDNDGRFRKQVRMAEIYFAPKELIIEREREHFGVDLLTSDVPNRALKKKLLQDLLTAAGIADATTPLKTDVVVTKDTLVNFAKCFRHHSAHIEAEFELSVRGDLEKKAARTLSDVLDLIGMETISESKKVQGKKVYSYRVDQGILDRMQEIICRRASESVAPAPDLDFSKGKAPAWRTEKKVSSNTKKRARQRGKHGALVSY